MDDPWSARPDDLPVSTENVVARVVDAAGRHRVEMNVGHNLAEVLIRIDNSRPVPALPEPPENAVSLVVGARNSTL